MNNERYQNLVALGQDNQYPNALIVDMDGTLAIHNGRSPYDFMRCEEDLVNEPIKHIVNKYWQDHIILIVSGRDDIVRDHCHRWLRANSIRFDDIMMRVTGDKRSDDIVKEEIFNNQIKDKYKVRFVLDDRDRVIKKWRELGLTALQVNYGDF